MTTTLIVCAIISFLLMGMFPIPYELSKGSEAIDMWIFLFIIVCLIVLPTRWLVLWAISLF